MLCVEYRETDLETIPKWCPRYCSFLPWGGDEVHQKFLVVLLLYSVYLIGGNLPNTSWSSESPITTAVGLDSIKEGKFAINMVRNLKIFYNFE